MSRTWNTSMFPLLDRIWNKAVFTKMTSFETWIVITRITPHLVTAYRAPEPNQICKDLCPPSFQNGSLVPNVTWLLNPVRISVFHWLLMGWSPNGNYPYLVNGFSSVDLKGEMCVVITLRFREMTQHSPLWYTGEAHVRDDPWFAGVATAKACLL